MIIASIETQSHYSLGPLWDRAFDFLRNATPDLALGCHVLVGDDLFAGVDCYETKPRDAAKLETHRTYIDIQLLLSGRECIEVFDPTDLRVEEAYRAEKDATFYRVPERAPTRITLRPGQFAVFFPEDAHLPGLQVSGVAEPVQKIVIKLRADALRRETASMPQVDSEARIR